MKLVKAKTMTAAVTIIMKRSGLKRSRSSNAERPAISITVRPGERSNSRRMVANIPALITVAKMKKTIKATMLFAGAGFPFFPSAGDSGDRGFAGLKMKIAQYTAKKSKRKIPSELFSIRENCVLRSNRVATKVSMPARPYPRRRAIGTTTD